MKYTIQLQTFFFTFTTALGVLFFLPYAPLASDLDSQAPPDDANSGMFTLQTLCERLNIGAMGTKREVNFVEPSTGAMTKFGCSFNEIMQLAPVVDDTNGATPAEVMAGKTFWSLRTDGTWGFQTGTLPSQTFNHTTVNQPAGYYDTFDLSVADLSATATNLVAHNIKKDINIFGVVGTYAGFSSSCTILPITKTGQVTSYYFGDDGTYQTGATATGLRFTDNGNGTVTDNLTGLIWTKNANCPGTPKTWQQAMDYANAMANGICELSDNSVAGDWRLPHIKEFQTLIDFSKTPSLPNGYPFSAVQSNHYWSSTPFVASQFSAWRISLKNGGVFTQAKSRANYVWLVRSKK